MVELLFCEAPEAPSGVDSPGQLGTWFQSSRPNCQKVVHFHSGHGALAGHAAVDQHLLQLDSPRTGIDNGCPASQARRGKVLQLEAVATRLRLLCKVQGQHRSWPSTSCDLPMCQMAACSRSHRAPHEVHWEHGEGNLKL